MIKITSEKFYNKSKETHGLFQKKWEFFPRTWLHWLLQQHKGAIFEIFMQMLWFCYYYVKKFY